MKSSFLYPILFALFASCSHSNSTLRSNSWIFEGVTYNALSCSAVSGNLYASTGNAGNYGSDITVYFNNNTLPTSDGIYTVVNRINSISPNQVAMVLTTNTFSTTYFSTGGNGNQRVTVMVSDGKISISGIGIEMLNNSNVSDSSGLNFSIEQL